MSRAGPSTNSFPTSLLSPCDSRTSCTVVGSLRTGRTDRTRGAAGRGVAAAAAWRVSRAGRALERPGARWALARPGGAWLHFHCSSQVPYRGTAPAAGRTWGDTPCGVAGGGAGGPCGGAGAAGGARAEGVLVVEGRTDRWRWRRCQDRGQGHREEGALSPRVLAGAVLVAVVAIRAAVVG